MPPSITRNILNEKIFKFIYFMKSISTVITNCSNCRTLSLGQLGHFFLKKSNISHAESILSFNFDQSFLFLYSSLFNKVSAFSKSKWPNISQSMFSIMPHSQNFWCSTMSLFFIDFQAACSCYLNSFNRFAKVFSGTANAKIWKCFLFQIWIWFIALWILPEWWSISVQEFSFFSTFRDCCTST